MNMISPLPRHTEELRIAQSGAGAGPVGSRAVARNPRHHPAEPAVADMWDSLALVLPDARTHATSGAPLVDYHRDHPTAKAFDLLRTRLTQALRRHGWSRIAIVAPTTSCGATFTAVNLALSLARVPGSRTVLVDLDQRKPGVAEALGLCGDWPIGEFLMGRRLMEEHMIRCSDTLALALNTQVYENASEHLHDEVACAVLEDTLEELSPDVVLYDLPAMLEYDDLAAFLPQVDGVLLIADGTRTTKTQIVECERILEGQTQLLGVVLNRGRESAP